MKIWLFCGTQTDGLRKLRLFIIKIYIWTWFEVPSAHAALLNNLNLMKRLVKYRSVDETNSEIAYHNFIGHLWYVSEELVALALFDL